MSIAANLFAPVSPGRILPDTELPQASMAPPFFHSAVERNTGERERPCKEKCHERVVLWIDHDGLFLAVAEERLRSHGFCALVAQSAVMGLFLLTIAKVQAVIVGDGVPGWEGARLARQVKEMRPELPVFLCGEQPYGGQRREDFPPHLSLEAILPKAGLGMERLAQRLGAAIQRTARAGAGMATDQASSSAPSAA